MTVDVWRHEAYVALRMETAVGELINLNRVRKDRAKAEAKSAAKTNRAAHGRTKAETAKAERERAAADRLLDGSKLED